MKPSIIFLIVYIFFLVAAFIYGYILNEWDKAHYEMEMLIALLLVRIEFSSSDKKY